MKSFRYISMAGFVVWLASWCHAQPFGNEWISYNQQYWKFKVAADGLYRISYESLQASGFPVSSVDPRQIQVWSREKQMHIYVAGEDDGQFQPGDYIELWATKNNAWLDSLFYDDPQHLPNPHFSLFNDTATYFITWVQSLNNARTGYYAQTNYNSYQPHPWCLFTSIGSYTDYYYIGEQDALGTALPKYQQAEGWFDAGFSMGQVLNKEIPTPMAYTASDAPPAQVYAVSASASKASPVNGFNHHLQVGYGNPFVLVYDLVFNDYKLNKLNFEIPLAELGSNTTRIVHRSINDLGIAADYNTVGLIEITYPRQLSFSDNSPIQVTLTNLYGADAALMELNNYPPNSRLFVPGHGLIKEIGYTMNGNTLRALVPFNGSSQVELLLVPGSAVTNLTAISPVTTSGYFTHYSATPLDSAFIIITHPKLWNEALNYRNHRNTTQSQAVVANIEELYMQYAGGVWKHPIAIRRFCDELLHTWPSPPAHLFLIGKSIYEMRLGGQQGARNNTEYYARNLVPTMGYPASDLALTQGLLEGHPEFAIPTGRLAAESGVQVTEYLNKVIQQEAQTPQLWQKNVLHFGGGSNNVEQAQFAGYLHNYRPIVSDTCFGGRVYTFLKTTNEPIDINLNDSIKSLIEQGVSLMTFFGHASSTGFDQNLDAPESYNNEGKYPLLIGNSCYTGNIHLPEGHSASENFTLVPNHGVIAFLAKSDLGAAPYLDLYTTSFYRHLFQTNYGKSIGQCMQLVAGELMGPGPGSAALRENAAFTFALHGDPAIKLYPWPKPDYHISSAAITFEPGEVSAALDSFKLKVFVSNLGKAVNKPVGVDVLRHLPNGTQTISTQELPKILHSQSVEFTLPVNSTTSSGFNFFDVLVDYPANLVAELNDLSNNTLYGKSLLISNGDLFPAHPPEFAVMPLPQFTLFASTGNALEPTRTYVMQVDTTDTFDSPAFFEEHFTQSGGVVQWYLPFECEENRVYFWRCSPDSVDAQHSFSWRESSFQYIPGKTGWGQAHFFQQKKNALAGIDYNRDERKLEYTTGTVELGCEVYGNPQSYYEALATRWMIDLDVQEYAACTGPAIIVAVVDPVTLKAWQSNAQGLHPENDFGNFTGCGQGSTTPENYFIFRQGVQSEMLALSDMILNHIPAGHHLLIYTWRNADYELWQQYNPALFEVFAQLGALQIGVGENQRPFVFYTRMGQPETVLELYGDSENAFLDLAVEIEATPGAGVMWSTLIGPSPQWIIADWQVHALEAEPGDFTKFNLYGINQNNQQVWLSQWPEDPPGISNLAALVSAEEYPMLRLDAVLEDFQTQTPPQLDYWHVYHEPVAECALNPSAGFYFQADTLQAGQWLEVAVAIQNISPVNMDSLLVSYIIEDEQHLLHPVEYPRQAPLQINQTLFDTVRISTQGLAGRCVLHMEANPYIPALGAYDQLELHHFNNTLQLPFVVLNDNINPLLDVTFDGAHILNNDIVSAVPQIVITLTDENKFLLLNEEADTARFKIFITTPDVYQQPVYFSQTDLLKWTPASGHKNKCRIDYTPRFVRDGNYSLLVQASDKSGNKSGAYDYRINFKVITRPSITEVLNYPNPFTTSTRFVFTLTGTEPPDEMKIQIMTVGGNIVREITQQELGPLNIGRNITSFAWNGTDEFGDRLANGVYLYRVIARLNGEELPVTESGASPYFKKGFGKMYLMR